MIFRAIFWIAVVAILMPREPNLGLGRPGASASASGLFSKLTELIEPGRPACNGHQMACIAANGAVGELKSTAFQSFAEVKAELDEAKRERIAAR